MRSEKWGEPCSRRVDEKGGAGHAECRHSAFVGKERVQGRKAGLTWEDTDWSREKAVCDLSEDSIPEDGHLVEPGRVRHQEVGSVS